MATATIEKERTLPQIQKILPKQSIRPALKTEELSVYYGEKRAIENISLTFPENCVTALIGPSGCGKSTYLRSLNRMNDEIPGCKTEGGIIYKGININAPEVNIFEVRKKIGLVFQKPNPFAQSIFKNVAYGPKHHGCKNKQELEEIVEDSLRKAALWDEVKDQLHKSALQLSGGQQQRLCIARALAMQPNILLLDEPASALDPVSTGKIEELISPVEKRLYDYYRYAQYATGSENFRLYSVFLYGEN